jgi:hypothetical protein
MIKGYINIIIINNEKSELKYKNQWLYFKIEI